MNADRFTDIIRRKLESIRPEFTDKDWVRMQSTLRQAGLPQPGPSLTGQASAERALWARPWLTAAASVSTVVLLAFGAYQRYEINHLRQTVRQLKAQTSARPMVHQPNTIQEPTTTVGEQSPSVAHDRPIDHPNPTNSINPERQSMGHTDTVYITRYVAVPSPKQDRSVQQPDASAGQYAQTSPSSLPEGIRERFLRPTNPSEEKLRTPQPTTERPASAPHDQFTHRKRGPRGTIAQSLEPSSRTESANRSSTPTERLDQASDTRLTTGSSELTPPAETGQLTANVDLLSGRPLRTQSIDWHQALLRRAKRIQPTRSTSNVAQASASQPVERIATQFRAGIGSDVSLHAWNVGAVGEIRMGRRWSFGLGLSRSTYLGGTFVDDIDYDNRTKRNFRRQFVHGLVTRPGPQPMPQWGPQPDILNITTRTTRLQIPLSVGYRIPLNSAFSLLPTVGTYVNLSSAEQVTFYYRESQRGFDIASYNTDRPVDLINTLTLGTSVDWQRGHWAGQAGPLLTLPLKTDPDWQRNALLGMRVRVFYQF